MRQQAAIAREAHLIMPSSRRTCARERGHGGIGTLTLAASIRPSPPNFLATTERERTGGFRRKGRPQPHWIGLLIGCSSIYFWSLQCVHARFIKMPNLTWLYSPCAAVLIIAEQQLLYLNFFSKKKRMQYLNMCIYMHAAGILVTHTLLKLPCC